jgi:hypothetical protein
LLRHLLRGNLKPTSGRGTQIDNATSIGEEVILAVELDELESGTGAVTLLPGRRKWKIEVSIRLFRQ